MHNGGAAYFQLEPGTFHLQLFKKDSQKPGSHWDTDRRLRAQLFSPSRELLATLELPDAGSRGYDDAGWSPPVSGDMDVEIKQSGVYFLLVTVKRNSYFTSVYWGFESNAEKFMIDAGGGHVDTARIESIALLRGSDPLEVVYKPLDPAYSFSVQGLSENVKTIGIQNTNSTNIQSIPVEKGSVQAILQKSLSGQADSPLVVNLGDTTGAKLQIEGITTWQANQSPRIPLWTTRASAWFDVEKTRWLLWPRYQRVYLEDECSAPAKVMLRNVRNEPMEVTLLIEGGGAVSNQTVMRTLQPGEECPVQFVLNAVGNPSEVILKAAVSNAPPEYAVVEVISGKVGNATVSLPFAIPPLRQNPGAFGLQDGIDIGKEVYGELVDSKGREWRAGSNGVFVRENNTWKCVVPSDNPAFGTPDKTRLNIDADDRVYALFERAGRHLLVAAAGSDGPVSSVELPASATGRVLLQGVMTTNPSVYPPPVLMYKTVGPKISFWSANNSFTVYLPEWDGPKLKIKSELVLAENCLAHCISIAEYRVPGSAECSSNTAYIAAYGITSPLPEFKNDSGVPVYVRTFDRSASHMSDARLIGYAPPKNDMHNAPSVLVDSKGYCHVILGGHNASFLYTRSEEPGKTDSWLPVVEVAPGYDQTYVHAVAGNDGAIHLVSRIWRRGSHFPNDEFDTALVYQRKVLDQPWTTPQVLVTPAMGHYSHYYHRLTIAPSGRLCFAWTYWSTWSSYRNELSTLGPGGDASFGYLYWVSDDNGETWKFNCQENKNLFAKGKRCQ